MNCTGQYGISILSVEYPTGHCCQVGCVQYVLCQYILMCIIVLMLQILKMLIDLEVYHYFSATHRPSIAFLKLELGKG